jgi:hypothetical protein
MLRRTALSACASTLLLSQSALAHHPGGGASAGGSGPIATLSATTLEKGHGVAGITLEMVRIDTFSNARLEALAGQHVHAHGLDAILAPSLVYAYGLTDDLTVMGRLPYIVRYDIREGAHSHGPAGDTVDMRGDAGGIGDLTLMAQYRFLNDRRTRTEAALLAGLQVPTGRTGVRDRKGALFEAEFQPGTGSWDGLLGLAFTHRIGAWSFDASMLYRLATTGAQQTDLGDGLLYNVAASYRILGSAPASGPPAARPHQHHHHHPHEGPPAAPNGPALDLVLELNGEWHGREVIAGLTEANSGGTVVYLSPGMRLSLDAWAGFVSVGVPVLDRVNGIQAEHGWRLLTGVSVAF